MGTQTLSYTPAFEDAATETAPQVQLGPQARLRDVAELPHGRTFPPVPALRERLSNIGRWVIAVTATTTPLGSVDTQRELRRSGASSIVWFSQRRRGREISLREARAIAFAILTDTERRLSEERLLEARFVLELWDEDAGSE